MLLLLVRFLLALFLGAAPVGRAEDEVDPLGGVHGLVIAPAMDGRNYFLLSLLKHCYRIVSELAILRSTG